MEFEEERGEQAQKNTKFWTKVNSPESIVRPILLALLFIGLILIVVTILYIALTGSTPTLSHHYVELEPPDVEQPLPESPSKLKVFPKAAVCSDAPVCAKIGRDILALPDATAIDSMVATLFCNGLYGMQSSGIGGGFVMTYYQRDQRKAYILNARETAPLNATEDMFLGNAKSANTGAKAAGVPGELKGYYAVWQRFGRLPWNRLVEPSIDLCTKGFNMSNHMSRTIDNFGDTILKDPILREMLTDPDTKKQKPAGAWIKPYPKLCDTLKIISQKGVDEFYNGVLGDDFILDVQEMGGILTKEDLRRYSAPWTEASYSSLYTGETLVTTPAPNSGDILVYIMNILNGYKLSPDSVRDENSTVLTLHRMVEAYKYAYAKRTELGDPDFVDIRQLLSNLTSQSVADMTRSKISDFGIQEDYGGTIIKEDHGTAHISIIAPNGDAVAVTSSVNTYFGARVVSRRTGIVLNSGMDDFSTPGFSNYQNIPPSKNNLIKPGKRFVSSVCPTIIFDRNGDVKLVIGASGGIKITSGLAQVIVKYIWFKENLKTAIDDARLYHILFPNQIVYEYGYLKKYIEDLYAYGHTTSRLGALRSTVICGVGRTSDNQIEANADYRKEGEVFGF